MHGLKEIVAANINHELAHGVPASVVESNAVYTARRNAEYAEAKRQERLTEGWPN